MTIVVMQYPPRQNRSVGARFQRARLNDWIDFRREPGALETRPYRAAARVRASHGPPEPSGGRRTVSAFLVHFHENAGSGSPGGGTLGETAYCDIRAGQPGLTAPAEFPFTDVVAGALTLPEKLFVGHDRLSRVMRAPVLQIGPIVRNTYHEAGCLGDQV